MSMNFLRADGTINRQAGNQSGWFGSIWLPSLRQIRDAVYFQINDAVNLRP